MYKWLDTNNILNIVLQEIYKEGIEIWCINGFKQYYYPIFAFQIVDYEEQVLIIGIKANMQYFIYHVLSKKKKNRYKIMRFTNP